MPTLRERALQLLIPSYFAERDQIRGLTERLLAAYQEGPYELPPEELLRQLREQFDPQLVMDLVEQLQWEPFGAGYQPGMEQQRQRAVQDSRRMWLYSVVAQWIIRLWTYYAVGESVEVIPTDEKAVEVWDEFWKADRNSPVLATERLHDISNMLLVTGNRFFVHFLSTIDGSDTVRRIRPEEIVQIVTRPGDDATPLFYKRQWQENSKDLMAYYPDSRWFFDEKYDLEALPKDGAIAERDETDVCIQHNPFEQKDETSLYGWPLLAPAGTPWLRSHRQFMENRLAVSRAVASYVRRRTTKGGSRAVDFIKATLGSTLQSGSTLETNPPPVAGSEDVTNQAMETEDLPLRTGASDAKVDDEMFSHMAALAGGLFPHYMGKGDAYRLATATAMEKPLQMQFSLYRNRLNAIWRDMVRIVLQAQMKYNGQKYKSYEARIAADRLVELDLDLIAASAGEMFKSIINPQSLTGGIPDEMLENTTVYSIQSILQAMGAEDVGDMVNVDQYEEEPGLEAELTEHQRIMLRLWMQGRAPIHGKNCTYNPDGICNCGVLKRSLEEQKPEGQPLPEWPDEPVPISDEDKDEAGEWAKDLDPEIAAMNQAVTDEEAARA